MTDIIDSYVGSDDGGIDNFYALHPSATGDYSAGGQCFTGKAGYKISSVKFKMLKVGSPTGHLVACIYNITGSYGSTGTPTGAALATSNTVNAADLPTSFDWVEFTFASPLAISAQYYAVTMQCNDGFFDWQNYVTFSADSTSPAHDGNAFDYHNSAWGAYDWLDVNFYVYGSLSAITAGVVDTVTQIVGSG